KRLVRRHLSLAFPEHSDRTIRAMTRETFRMLGKNAGEVLRTSRISTLEQLNRILVTHDYENFEAANRKGKGVIFLTCHLGAFDLQVTNMALRGLSPNIIGTPLTDPTLHSFDLVYAFRHCSFFISRSLDINCIEKSVVHLFKA